MFEPSTRADVGGSLLLCGFHALDCLWRLRSAARRRADFLFRFGAVAKTCLRFADATAPFFRDMSSGVARADLCACFSGHHAPLQAGRNLRAMFRCVMAPAFRRRHLCDRFWRQSSFVQLDQSIGVIQALMVRFRGAQSQVLHTIIGLDAIDVMDRRACWNGPVRGLPDDAMFHRPVSQAVCGFDVDVPAATNGARPKRRSVMCRHDANYPLSSGAIQGCIL